MPPLPAAAERRAEEGESAAINDDRSLEGEAACGVVACCRTCCCWCRGDVGDAMGALERYRRLSEFRPVAIFFSTES